jgi:uncharacterized Zn finger protein
MARWQSWDDDDRFGRFYPPSRPLAAKGGIKARNKRGAFAESWWGRRWITVLESFGLGTRLTRGRSYARSGQVVSLEIKPGEVNAAVQGSRPNPYKVRILLQKIEPKQRVALGRALAQDISIAAKLIGGQLPPEIEQCFEQADSPLFPHRSKDLVTSCSCPDSSNPCKHIAAVYYLLAEEFDRDPFLLLQLRAISHEEFMSLLGGASAEKQVSLEQSAARQAQPLAANPQTFWRPGTMPEISYGDITQTEEGAPMARRLGAFPLWRGNADFLEEIARMSRLGAANALARVSAMREGREVREEK